MPRMASGGPWGTLDHADAARTDCLVKRARVLAAEARWRAVLESMIVICDERRWRWLRCRRLEDWRLSEEEREREREE